MPTAYDVLALPLRRRLLDALRSGPATVGELADGLGIAQPTVSKQLRILREGGFVEVRAEAQRRWYTLRGEPFAEIAQWLEPYRWLWEERLDRLGSRLDQMQDEEQS